jgi:hypothetical protein
MKYPETLNWRTGYNGGVTGPSVSPLVYLDEKEDCEHTLVVAKYATDLGYESNQAVAVCFGEHQEEHAQYIVTAANMLPKFVTMLEQLIEYCEMYSEEEAVPVFIDGDIKEARELLSKVKT